MKEIIYIQAGTLSNYIGTHFWNAQESYFTYEEGDDAKVTHDISFREGQTLKGEPTFCPRLLLFDRKSNFGALGDGLYGAEETEDDTVASQWNGPVDEFRQPPVPKSAYQARLEAEAAEYAESGDDEASDTSDVRYWSDYSRVYFHPRTLQRLPNLADYENVEGDWNVGGETFTRWDEETDLMDDSFRFLTEECDNMQGLQVINDNSSFGSFTHSFLTAFRDEFNKLPCWTFSLFSDCVPASLNVDSPRSIRNAINDALCIQGLNELSTLNVPLQSPTLWERGTWLNGLNMKSNLYHTSSLLSTHIESITLPFRLTGSEDTMSSMSSLLSARGNQSFAHLSGAFPVPASDTLDFTKVLYDLSLSIGKPIAASNGCIDVTRTPGGVASRSFSMNYSLWRDQWRSAVYHADSFEVPLPTSYPKYFAGGSPPSPLCSLSSVSTTTRSAILFAQYAKLADDCTKQHASVAAQMGLELDDVKELRDNLRVLEDEYRGDDDYGEDAQGDTLGEDEE